MRALIIMLLALAAPLLARSQPCLPSDNPLRSDSPAEWVQPAQNTAWIGSPLRVGFTVNGLWSRYHCAEVGTGRLVAVSRVSTSDDLPNVGGRIRTIIRASDPLKSLQSAGQRITILPLGDPALSAIVADMEAGRGEL